MNLSRFFSLSSSILAESICVFLCLAPPPSSNTLAPIDARAPQSWRQQAQKCALCRLNTIPLKRSLAHRLCNSVPFWLASGQWPPQTSSASDDQAQLKSEKTGTICPYHWASSELGGCFCCCCCFVVVVALLSSSGWLGVKLKQLRRGRRSHKFY